MASTAFKNDFARAQFSFVVEVENVADGRRTAPKILSLEKILNPSEPLVVESRSSTKDVCLDTTTYELSRDSTPERLTSSQLGSSPFSGLPDRPVILLTACDSSPTRIPHITKGVRGSRPNSRLYDTSLNQQTSSAYHLDVQKPITFQHDSPDKCTIPGVKEEENPKSQPSNIHSLPEMPCGSAAEIIRPGRVHSSEVNTPPRMQVNLPSLPLTSTPLSWQPPLIYSQRPFEPSMQGPQRSSISSAPNTIVVSHPRIHGQHRLPDSVLSAQTQQAHMRLPGRMESIPIHIDTSTASIRADRKRKRNAAASTKYRRRKKMVQEKEFKDYQKLLEQRRLMENKIVELTQQAHFYRQECIRLQDVIRQTSSGSFVAGLPKPPL